MFRVQIAQRFNSFWICGAWSVVLGVLVCGAAQIVQLEVDLLIVCVVGIGFWIGLLLTARRTLVQHASAQISHALARSRSRQTRTTGAVLCELRNALLIKSPTFGSRDTASGPEDADYEFTAATHAAAALLDDTNDEIAFWYGPIQALVWSLPAVGFLGMAWHLRAILHIRLDGGSISRQETLAGLAAPLTSALLVVCAALMLTAIAHVATALAFRAELASLHRLRAGLNRLVAEHAGILKRSRRMPEIDVDTLLEALAQRLTDGMTQRETSSNSPSTA